MRVDIKLISALYQPSLIGVVRIYLVKISGRLRHHRFLIEPDGIRNHHLM